MPPEFKFEVVPLSQVPLESPLTPSDIKVNSLEAVSDGKIDDGSSDALQREDALEIPGLPGGLKAWIAQQSGRHRVVLETCHGDAELLGEYSSLKDAMNALSTRLRAR